VADEHGPTCVREHRDRLICVMAVPTPPKLFTNNPTETSIHVWWQEAAPSGIKQQLVVREFPKPWSEARVIDVESASAYTVTGLFPTSTFEFRLQYVLADGTTTPPGPTIACDTLAAGCTPKDDGAGGDKKRNGCVVQ
jgi:hypothetical protein